MKKKLFSILLSLAMVVTMMPMQTVSVAAATKAKTSVTVSTQKGLNKAVKNKKLKTLTIKTSKSKTLTVPNGTHKNVYLVVDAPKSTVKNKAVFKKITIKKIRNLKGHKSYIEYAKNNTIVFNVKAADVGVAKGASIKEAKMTKADSSIKFTVNGELKKVNVDAKTTLKLSGPTTKPVTVNVSAKSENTKVTSSVKVTVNAEINATVILNKGAEGSTIALNNKDAEVTVVNNTNEAVKAVNAEGKTVTVKNNETVVIGEEEEATPSSGGGGGGGSSAKECTDEGTLYYVAAISEDYEGTSGYKYHYD
ncbi:MAG: hypothetical protein Q4E99_04295, partial [Bacillota bacterium]|nr:hypothetical protein [Bacillota bacterium]